MLYNGGVIALAAPNWRARRAIAAPQIVNRPAGSSKCILSLRPFQRLLARPSRPRYVRASAPRAWHPHRLTCMRDHGTRYTGGSQARARPRYAIRGLDPSRGTTANDASKGRRMCSRTNSGDRRNMCTRATRTSSMTRRGRYSLCRSRRTTRTTPSYALPSQRPLDVHSPVASADRHARIGHYGSAT